MGNAAQPGQFDLLLSLGEPGPVLIALLVKTMGTADPLLVAGTRLVVFGYRQPAGVALVIAAFFQAVVNGNPFVKYEAFALPFRRLLVNLLKVFEDAPLKMINLFKPLLLKVRRGFFAADPAGTVHGDLAVGRRVQVVTHIAMKISNYLTTFVRHSLH